MNDCTHAKLYFDDFTLDEDNAQLTRNGQPVALPPKAFALLCTLVKRCGQLTKKDALLDAVWGHRHVSESVLKTTISQLRVALNDNATQPRFIETVARLGYRFIGTLKTQDTAVGANSTAPLAHETAPWFAVSPLIGRQPELTQLHASWQRANAGQRQLIFLTGDAGIGKTTILDSFCSQLPNSVIARGQCVEQYGGGEPYLPVLEMLGALCRQFEELKSLMREVAPIWLVQFPWLLDAAERAALQQELRDSQPQRMLRELTELLQRFCRERPLLFIIEDLHWSDHATLRLLDYFARQQQSLRLLWICSLRATQLPLEQHPLHKLRQELRLHRLCEEIALNAFSAAEVGSYVESRWPAAKAPATFARRLHEHTDGLPLFVANVVDVLLAEHDAVEKLQALQAPLLVPDDLIATIEQQIAQLPEQRRELLEAAAVCGMEFRSTVLAQVLQRDVNAVSELCDVLTRQQFWLRETGFAELPDGLLDIRIVFRHALHRHALYQRTGSLQRTHYHRRAARALEQARANRIPVPATELASHFERGHEYLNALRFYVEAITNAMSHFAPSEALLLATQAFDVLSRCDAGAERDELALTLNSLHALANSLLYGLASPQATQAFENARALAGQLPQTPQQAMQLTGFGWMLFTRGEFAQALTLAQQVDTIADRCDDAVLRVCACNLMGMTLAVQGKHRSAMEWLWRGIALCEQFNDAIPLAIFVADPEVSMRAIASMPLCSLGLIDEARQQLSLAFERAQKLGQPTAMALSHRCGAQFEARLSNTTAVDTLVAVMEYHATHAQLVQAAGPALWLRGLADVRQGNIEIGYQKILQGYAMHADSGMLATCTEVLGYAAEARTLAQDWVQAQSHIDAALQLAEDIGEYFVLPQLNLLAAKIAQARGDKEAARALVEKALEIAKQQEAIGDEKTIRTELKMILENE